MNRTEAWKKYLSSDSGLTKKDIATVESLLSSIEETCPGFECPLQAQSYGDGILLAWDDGPHHFNIDLVLPGLAYQWFYRNRDTGYIKGAEGVPVGSVTYNLKACLYRFKSKI